MKTEHLTAILIATFLAPGGLTLGQETLENSIQATLLELQEKKTSTAAKIELVTELGKLGPTAEHALEVLLDPEFYLEHVRPNPPLKEAVLDTLIRIGEPSVGAVLELARNDPKKGNEGEKTVGQTEPEKAEEPSAGGRSEAKKAHKHAKKRAALRKAMQEHVNGLLRQLAAGGLEKEVIAALEQQLMNKKKVNSGVDFVPLAQIGSAASPALKRVMKARNKFNAYTVGPDPDFMPDIPERFTPELWNGNKGVKENFDFRKVFYSGAAPEDIPALLDPLRDDRLLRGEYHRAPRLTGMMLSGMGDAPAQPLAALLSDADPRTRREAAFVLGMLGPTMKAALPALDEVYQENEERIDVRAQAARAIASIKEEEAAKLYEAIPDAQDRIVEHYRQEHKRLTQDRAQWEAHFASDSTKSAGRHFALANATAHWEEPMVKLATNEDVKAVNQLLRNTLKKLVAGIPEEGLPMDDPTILGGKKNEVKLFLHLFGAGSRYFPGRLEPDVEKAIRETIFEEMSREKEFEMGFFTKPGKSVRYSKKTVEYYEYMLAKDETAKIISSHNGPMSYETKTYLDLIALNGDPEFAQRKFKNGDTVAERYDHATRWWRRGMKDLALHGMWGELGSSNYESKTFRALMRLVEFADDPIVSQRAKMLMDLALIEIEQISISNLRGGSKTRAKDGGLGSDFNNKLSVYHGEVHGFNWEPPGFDNYELPAPAILLRQMGPTKPVYEIRNRHLGEDGTLRSRYLNYAYCTPEYVTGCSMFDVRLWHKKEGDKKATFQYGAMGKWTGVIFRNSAAIEFPSYTGEKFSVQDKDVMIAQIFKGAAYSGRPYVHFASIKSENMLEEGGWVFVENQQAYAAVRPARGGYRWNEPARRRMDPGDAFSPIIVQTGREAVYGNFENFQKAILAAPLEITHELLDYTGPNSARIEFFLCKDSDEFEEAYPKSLPRIDGEELDLNLEHNYRSPYLNNTVGSDVVTVSYGERTWEYDFENNTVTEKK